MLPALVVGIGLVGAVLILLGRAFARVGARVRAPELDLRRAASALVGVVVVLTWLGVSLPRE